MPCHTNFEAMTYQISNLKDYETSYKESVENPEAFWASQAESFRWHRKWDKVLEWDFKAPSVKWFEGGVLNITENCLDRHIADRAEQIAFYWEPNDPSQAHKMFSYKALLSEVCRCANAFKANGITKGDRIVFYMPMVPELLIGVLACARIGAVHSVVFAGFSAQALADRINDAQAKMVICSDYNHRGPKCIPVKDVVDQAMELGCPSVRRVLVHKNTGGQVKKSPLDRWLHEELEGHSDQCPAEPMDAEDMLFILYTSGSTGKPKGVVHTCGGYMVYTEYSFKNVFQYREGDVWWCTADIGWITGHSYIIYGPLLAGATSVMFEGVPTYPDAGRFWAVCEKYKVSQFYTAPTALRALMAKGYDLPSAYDLSALKVLGSVGEPINEEAWHWYNEKVGNQKAPIVDTWWQTETGGIMISPLPGITDTKPTFASYPLPGIQPVLVDSAGSIIEGNNVEGLLCIRFPWPSILRTTYGDHERCRQTYFSQFEGLYFTGDGARRDAQGRIRVIGRVDDVLNVSGHRLGTAELENAINEHPTVIESAVVGYPHPIKGEGIYAYVIADKEVDDLEAFVEDLRNFVAKGIGPIAKPDKIQVVNGLPKTRSGKIMRRILKKIAMGDEKNMGDISTLLNPEIVRQIIQAKQKQDK